ncbi:YicC/YloC family endoribonuclease [Methylocystis sp.]|uniref:YicC/YloC family endoribonuclease n=1 Tax=Methylocystis sp. TaxID=1911079 RepID=UPI0025CDC0A6|nr:YicC/YloC family endoribonuclease [Methylocystis sp.]
MSLHSMTGFARVQGAVASFRYAWELKSVNAKGLDLRLRAPPDFDSVEIKAREKIAARLARGAVIANLAARREDESQIARLNRPALDALLAALSERPPPANVGPATLDGLLGLRGVVEIVEPELSDAERAELEARILGSLDQALDALIASRRAEGEALAGILRRRLDRISALAAQADAAPARQPEAIRARLKQQVARLLENAEAFDPARLHQEATLLAVRADIREELDRLKAHVESASKLLVSGGPVGRRLDFLAQELGRETNTLCAKSNDAGLTAIGLELKIEVEQLREQVQNIE